jgi:hypothetical protein
MAYAFDTLGYAKRLRDAGISQGQAEAHAEAAREFVMGELVTKADLLAIRPDLEAIKADLQATKADLLAIRPDLEAIKADLQAAKADLQAAKAGLQAAMDTLSLRLTLRLGVMLAAGLATLAAIIKL